MLNSIAPLALTLISSLISAPLDEKPPELDYSALAAEFRDAHGLNNAQPENITLQDLLDGEHYRKFNLGLFDIRIPGEALKDKQVAKNFVTCALATLDAQHHWVSWTALEHDQFESITNDFIDVRKSFVKWL